MEHYIYKRWLLLDLRKEKFRTDTVIQYKTGYSLSRYEGRETKQKPLYYVFVSVYLVSLAAALCVEVSKVYVNLCTIMVIELIVFSRNKAIIQ